MLSSQGSWVRYPVWQHTFVSPSAFSRRAVVSYWRKYVHEVLVNRLGGLSLPRKSVVRLTDRPDMTLDVYRGRKTTIQQYNCLLSCHCNLNEIAWTKQLTDCIHLIYSYLMRYVTVCCLLFLEISFNSTVSWPLLLIVKHSYGAIIDVININVLLFHIESVQEKHLHFFNCHLVINYVINSIKCQKSAAFY